MRRIIKYCLLAGLFPLVACSKDSIEEDDEYCLNPKYKVPLEVTVNLDKEFKPYKLIDSVYNKTRSKDSLPSLKYYVAAYPMTSGLPKVVKNSYEKTIPIQIHPGRYTVVGWVMYETTDESRGYNFYDDDFNELLLRSKYNYSGADEYKIAYRGAEPKNIPYNATSVAVTAKPAMALYKLVATDTAAFYPEKVIISYSSLLPSAINAKTGNINWWWRDISYNSTVIHQENEGDLLAADYVLSQNDQETSVTVIVEIYDEKGRLRARKKNLEIPLMNGGITTVRGNFYSVLETDNYNSAGSGISIKTEWDASFEIAI